MGSALVTFLGVIAFRGLIDIIAHRLIPRPSLYGADKADLAEDARARRRVWYWRKKFRHTLWIVGVLFALLLMINILQNLTGHPHDLKGTLDSIGGVFGGQNSSALLDPAAAAAAPVPDQLRDSVRADDADGGAPAEGL